MPNMEFQHKILSVVSCSTEETRPEIPLKVPVLECLRLLGITDDSALLRQHCKQDMASNDTDRAYLVQSTFNNLIYHLSWGSKPQP